MIGGDDYTPWVKHDGADPRHLGAVRLLLAFPKNHDGRLPDDPMNLPLNHPCWFWRWQWVRAGWFKWDRRRVCDDPAYAPIIAYRVRRPRGMAVVLGLLENLPDTAPDGGGEVVPIKARPKPQKVQP